MAKFKFRFLGSHSPLALVFHPESKTFVHSWLNSNSIFLDSHSPLALEFRPESKNIRAFVANFQFHFLGSHSPLALVFRPESKNIRAFVAKFKFHFFRLTFSPWPPKAELQILLQVFQCLRNSQTTALLDVMQSGTGNSGFSRIHQHQGPTRLQFIQQSRRWIHLKAAPHHQ